MLAADGVIPDPWALMQHAQLTWDGKVAPRLMWEKHQAATVVSGVLLLAIFGFLKRLLFGRRRKVVIREVPVVVSASAPPIKSGRGKA
jgi:hypothetical protein